MNKYDPELVALIYLDSGHLSLQKDGKNIYRPAANRGGNAVNTRVQKKLREEGIENATKSILDFKQVLITRICTKYNIEKHVLNVIVKVLCDCKHKHHGEKNGIFIINKYIKINYKITFNSPITNIVSEKHLDGLPEDPTPMNFANKEEDRYKKKNFVHAESKKLKPFAKTDKITVTHKRDDGFFTELPSDETKNAELESTEKKEKKKKKKKKKTPVSTKKNAELKKEELDHKYPSFISFCEPDEISDHQIFENYVIHEQQTNLTENAEPKKEHAELKKENVELKKEIAELKKQKIWYCNIINNLSLQSDSKEALDEEDSKDNSISEVPSNSIDTQINGTIPNYNYRNFIACCKQHPQFNRNENQIYL
jgi:hypothetical protein